MAQWDFSASVEELVALSGEGRGPTSMSAMLSAAHEVVARLRARDPVALQQWLDANAEPLIAQQMLARSVHAQQDSSDQMSALLGEWLVGRTGTATGELTAVGWLREEHPAQLRAWLLSQVDRLVEDEIARLESA